MSDNLAFNFSPIHLTLIPSLTPILPLIPPSKSFDLEAFTLAQWQRHASNIGDLELRTGSGIVPPLSQTSTSTRLTSSSNNSSSRFPATTGTVHLREHDLKQKESLDPTKVGNAESTCQEKAPENYEKVYVDNTIEHYSSQMPYRNRTTEDEEVELRKTPYFASYQLQQWMLETSNSCITFAERLEKSKEKYQGTGNGDNLCGGNCDEDWGRKSYDWILFSE